MYLRVLGSAAGGGFPQWNCNCRHCDGVRRGLVAAKPRTQSSVAVSVDGIDWLLVNASPDILQQIRDNPDLQPARALRDSGIAAVVVVDAQIDHVTGLLMLREGRKALPLYATAEVFSDLSTGFPIINLLSHYCGVDPRTLSADGTPERIDHLAGLVLRAYPVASQPPPYSPYRGRARPGDNIALGFENPATGKRIVYAPGLAQIDAPLRALMADAHVVLVDGTFWSGDEMQRLGLSNKHALEMGHLPLSGPGGMLEHLQKLPSTTRKILIHINNTNPILLEDSPERRELETLGIEVAYDGMNIEF